MLLLCFTPNRSNQHTGVSFKTKSPKTQQLLAPPSGPGPSPTSFLGADLGRTAARQETGKIHQTCGVFTAHFRFNQLQLSQEISFMSAKPQTLKQPSWGRKRLRRGSRVWPQPSGFAAPLHPQLLRTCMKTNRVFGRKRCNLELTLCLGPDLNFTRYFYINFIYICFLDIFFFTHNWQENIQFASNQFPCDFFFFVGAKNNSQMFVA